MKPKKKFVIRQGPASPPSTRRSTDRSTAPLFIQVESRIGGRRWWSDLDDQSQLHTVTQAVDAMHKLMGVNGRLVYRVIQVIAS